MYEYTEFKKVRTADLEKHLGVELLPGLNPISLDVQRKKSTMQLKFSVVVPTGQMEDVSYAYVLVQPYQVVGRGSVTYEDEIFKEFKKGLATLTLHLPRAAYREDLVEEITLIGYSEYKDYEAIYATFRSATFKEKREVLYGEYRDRKGEPISLSTPDELVVYQSEGWHREYSKMFYGGGVYHFVDDIMKDNEPTWSLSGMFEDPTGYARHACVYLLDNQNNIWKKAADYLVPEQVDAEIGRNMDRFGSYAAVIMGEHFYQLEDVLSSHIDDNQYVYHNNIFYQWKAGVPILTGTFSEPVPFMETTIPTLAESGTSGTYYSMEVNGERMVVIPSTSGYATDESKFLVYDHRIYLVVGPIADVGFVLSDERRVSKMRIGVRPEIKGLFFRDHLSDIQFGEAEDWTESSKTKHHTPIVYDESFKNHTFDWKVGDIVYPTAELTEESKLVGVPATIRSIWNNRAGADVRFFGHFDAEFPFSQLAKD